LRFEINHSPSSIVFNQQKYCLYLLYGCGFLACKPVISPMQPSCSLYKREGSLLLEPSQYKRLIGRLLYITHTKPDINFAIQN